MQRQLLKRSQNRINKSEASFVSTESLELISNLFWTIYNDDCSCSVVQMERWSVFLRIRDDQQVRKVTQKEQSCHQSEPCNLVYASTLISLKWLHFAGQLSPQFINNSRENCKYKCLRVIYAQMLLRLYVFTFSSWCPSPIFLDFILVFILQAVRWWAYNTACNHHHRLRRRWLMP